MVNLFSTFSASSRANNYLEPVLVGSRHQQWLAEYYMGRAYGQLLLVRDGKWLFWAYIAGRSVEYSYPGKRLVGSVWHVNSGVGRRASRDRGQAYYGRPFICIV
jgi:hypothetical protein